MEHEYENDMLKEPLFALARVLLSIRKLGVEQAEICLRRARVLNQSRTPAAKVISKVSGPLNDTGSASTIESGGST